MIHWHHRVRGAVAVALVVVAVGALVLATTTTTTGPILPFARAFGHAATVLHRGMPPSTRRSLARASKTVLSAVPRKKPKLETQIILPVLSSIVVSEPPMDPEQARLLLQSWTSHTHADYHNFANDEAVAIRSALLEWYTSHRRKLPWRGDPPPFDGSTSGINTNSNSNKKRRKNSSANQQPITSFFGASKVKKEKKEPYNNNNDTTASGAAIPVTGYGVWVSEIMLQQTRVEAVIPYWIKWMNSFPTVYELAAATEDEVNAHWAGLGFYRRARFLHQGAKYVVQDLNGELPQTREELSKITGIGPYTASAIASIAFGVCVPVVDGNVCRVLSRLTGIANHIKHPILKDKLGWKLAAQIVEAGDGSHPGLVNQALMELGATYCAPAGSGVDDKDPLKNYYMSTKLGMAYRTVRNAPIDLEDLYNSSNSSSSNQTKECCELCDPNGTRLILEQFEETIFANSTTNDEAARAGHAAFPTDPPKTDKREEDLAMAVLSKPCDDDDDNNNSLRYLMVKRPKDGLLAGQWEFPNVCVQIRKKSKAKSKPASKSVDTKLPTPRERGRALTKLLLDDLFSDHPNEDIADAISGLSRSIHSKEPLEHIFSHVKHYMWVESGRLSADVNLIEETDLAWKSPSGKEVRWMNKQDMKEVGITSGVKKVLQSVEKASSKTTTKRRSK